jgi:hexosaminidase
MSRSLRASVACSASAVALLAILVLGAGVAGAHHGSPAPPQLVPKPASLTTTGSSFALSRRTVIVAPGQARSVGSYLAGILRPSTGYALPVVPWWPGKDRIRLDLTRGGDREAYRLDVSSHGVKLRAGTPEGLFRGVQTLRQLLPPQIESTSRQQGPFTAPGVHISDRPRFPWRGAMVDVARHFFTVQEIERYIDELSLYKVNVLHLHLSDDQGWRIVIDSWPRLATYGGSLEVGGTPGGYYTKQDYKEIVRYAAAHYITLIPEIDSPGHTNAALASYAELNCDGVAPPLYTGIDVGFSSLCVNKDITYKFLDDVVGEIAAMTPGPYFDIGGDEAHSTPPADYQTFLAKIQQIVHKHGKAMSGWADISAAPLRSDSVAQYWNPASGSDPGTETATNAVKQGVKLVMSPASKAYLDMKYTPETPLGLHWAGYVEVQDSYSWDPVTFVNGISESDVLGVEGPVWSETLQDIHDIEFMAFPRIAGLAEIGWSPRQGRSWDEYKTRLAAQGPRWNVMGINYYRSPQVPWPAG